MESTGAKTRQGKGADLMKFATEALHPGLEHAGEYTLDGPGGRSPVWRYIRILSTCEELWEIRRYPRKERGYANRWAWWAEPCARREPGEKAWEDIAFKDPEAGVYGATIDEVVMIIETSPD